MIVHTLKLSALLLALALIAGCSTTPKTDADGNGADVEEGAAAGTTGGAYGSGGEGAVTSGVGAPGAWTGSPLDDPASPLSTRTIYFDFDSSNIRPEFVNVLRAHAEYLLANPGLRMTLEGHADERGTREYNLALGERRALMVKRFMMAEGINPAQVSEISYGEERPVDPGQGEVAWSRNRRVEIVY